MMPKAGDIVRLSSELFDVLRACGDGSWSVFKGCDLEVTKVVAQSITNCFFVFLIRVDGKTVDHIHFITTHEDGSKTIGAQVVRRVFVKVNEKTACISFCTCENPEFVVTGIGSLSFEVCRKCKCERK